MADGAQPLRVELVAYAPTAFYHCTHCEVVWQQIGFSDGVHDEQVRSALPPDLLADFQAVSDWVHHLLAKHSDRIAIKVIDAASPEGLWKFARYRLGRFPAVVVNGRKHFNGTDFSTAEDEIARLLGAGQPSP